MKNIKHKILVLSGKGGVGKSTIAVNLAVWLSMQGKDVGLLDIDIHGPSVPTLLGLESAELHATEDKIIPIDYNDKLKVISIGFLVQGQKKAFIWRGPMKHNVIKQFVTEVDWGDLDYLVVDCPPGTGDEPLSIAQLIPDTDGAVVVTTPQQLAAIDVEKCIIFCRQLNLPILGVIENMAGFTCPHCNRTTEIFPGNQGKQLANDSKVPFLGSIAIDPSLVRACDSGKPVINSNNTTAKALQKAFQLLLEPNEKHKNNMELQKKMRIAIPVTNGKLSQHFGHCEQFVVIDVDPDAKTITKTEMLAPPAHEPGALPRWLSEMSVNIIIAGGMGQRAQQLFEQNNIDVIVGAQDNTPEQLVQKYINGLLQSGENICDH